LFEKIFSTHGYMQFMLDFLLDS